MVARSDEFLLKHTCEISLQFNEPSFQTITKSVNPTFRLENDTWMLKAVKRGRAIR